MTEGQKDAWAGVLLTALPGGYCWRGLLLLHLAVGQ